MRDFRDAKLMARALRDALKARGVETTHSESLELIATAFGYENWNVLSAKIEAAAGAAGGDGSSPIQNDPAPPKETLYCSFCGKSQHAVRKMIAGPSTFICDECVELCYDIVDPDDDKELFRLLNESQETEALSHPALLELARKASTQELAHFVDSIRKRVERHRLDQERVARSLAAGTCNDGENTRARLVASQRHLWRDEEALSIAMTVLGGRRLQ